MYDELEELNDDRPLTPEEWWDSWYDHNEDRSPGWDESDEW